MHSSYQRAGQATQNCRMLRLDHQPRFSGPEAIESCAKLGPGRLDQALADVPPASLKGTAIASQGSVILRKALASLGIVTKGPRNNKSPLIGLTPTSRVTQ